MNDFSISLISSRSTTRYRGIFTCTCTHVHAYTSESNIILNLIKLDFSPFPTFAKSARYLRDVIRGRNRRRNRKAISFRFFFFYVQNNLCSISVLNLGTLTRVISRMSFFAKRISLDRFLSPNIASVSIFHSLSSLRLFTSLLLQ